MTPRVLLITAGAGTVGGIQRYCAELAAALASTTDLVAVDVALDGSMAGRARAFLKGLAAIVRVRPSVLVLGHVGLGPIGLVCSLVGLRYVVVVYGIEIWAEPTRLRRLTLARASAVWSISRFTKSEVERVYPTCRSARVIGGAVARRFLEARAEPAPEFRILSVARAEHVWYKGIDTCAAAARNVARDYPLQYRIAGAVARGADPLAEIGIEVEGESAIVSWLGELDEDALLDEYRKAGVVVLVSRYRAGPSPAGEGLGLAVLEAGALGVPTIGSSMGGTTDCIVDGRTGYLVPPDDVPALEKCLRLLLENPSLRQSMGEEARAWVAEHFSPEAFAGTLTVALADVTGPQAPGLSDRRG